jgi:cellulose synthase/poly-beta-1,6-N-acetylglucosamine synthase-like glycosyltransferase
MLILIAKSTFWICAFLIAYTYFVYPLFLFFAYALLQIRRDWQYLKGRNNRRCPPTAIQELPSVSMIVPAYNEQEHLPNKLANIEQLEYPREKLEVVFVSDGSTDRTNSILQNVEGPNCKVILLSERSGKPVALNHAVASARHGLLIFSDAATLFAPDAVQKLVRHFSRTRVGAVCGALKFRGTAESQQTEGVYWGYESMLRLMESRLGATLTASGAIYALRRECYLPLPINSVIEDFVIPMNARKLGYRVLYDPEAVATEFAAASIRGEFRRRVRLAVGSFRNLRGFLRVPLQRFTRFAFFSHKVLRWTVPFLLIGLLASNAFLLQQPPYRFSLIAQFLFYLWAVLGLVLHRHMGKLRFGLVGYFLLAMNVAFLVGFIHFLLGKTDATWERAS